MRLHPNATFDCLLVAQRLQAQGAAYTGPELHLFAYLACLLWLYQKNIVTDWGYSFVGTELGAPYSQEIDSALKELLGRGFFRRIHDRLGLTKLAETTLDEFTNLEMNRERAECLNAACASIAAFSLGMVTSALSQEPDLSRAKALPSNRLLLEDAAQSQLYVQFEALRSNLDPRTTDLRLPAVVWLSALYRSNASTTSES
jgi:hypothetical protein